MRALVTGAAGFLASHVIERLHADGVEVLAVDNFLTGREENLPASQPLILADICELDWDSLPAVDVVFHAAASYADPTNWERDARTNVVGTARVARYAKRADARVVYLQTTLCYGHVADTRPLVEDTPLAPRGSYAVSKTAGEAYLRDAGIDLVSFRLANMYGPRNLSGPVPAFYRKMKAGERCTVVDTRRDMVFVADAVNCFMAAFDDLPAGTYHVSSGSDVSIQEVWDAVAEEVPGSHEYDSVARGDDDVASLLLDATKIHKLTGWRPTVSLSEGIAAAVRWYDRHDASSTYTHLAVPGAR